MPQQPQFRNPGSGCCFSPVATRADTNQVKQKWGAQQENRSEAAPRERSRPKVTCWRRIKPEASKTQVPRGARIREVTSGALHCEKPLIFASSCLDMHTMLLPDWD